MVFCRHHVLYVLYSPVTTAGATVLDTARADLSGFHIFRLKECNGDVINDLGDINGLQGFHWQLETALPNLKTNSLNLTLVCILVIFSRYALYEPTAEAHYAYWLHLGTIPPTEYALPQTT